jgi:hypothetical protein
MLDEKSIVRHPLEWAPAPAVPGTPPHLNRVGVRRYTCRDPALDPTTILVLMPGFTGGVNDLDDLAVTLVTAGQGRVAVWAVERRNHLLEDLGGMELAEGAENPEAALAYYLVPGARCPVPGSDKDGASLPEPGTGHRAPGTFFSPLSGADTPWMASWGLKVALDDARAVVHEARRAVGEQGRVLLGGHSMGGMIAQCYAAWDFDGAPGHGELDGIVLIDGAVGGPMWTSTTGMEQYHAGAAAIAAGRPFWDERGRGAAPDVAILAQVAAMAASMPAWRERPSLVAPHIAGLVPLPEPIAANAAQLTNEAFFGLMVDAETGPFPSYRANVGQLDPSGDWLSHHHCGKPTELARVARALRQLDGTNGMEWYASRRLNAEIDLSSNLDSRDPATLAFATAAGLRLWHNASVRLPVFGAVARSDVQHRSRYSWYRDAIAGDDFTLLELPEYDHLDPLFAGDTEGGNRCTQALSEWLGHVMQRQGG